jgi:Rod binding domain-containing protein
MSAISGLPQIPETALPASVRNGSVKDKQAYRAALGFEQVLLGTLVKSMATSGPLADGPYAAPVQEAFTGSLVANGGLGLGTELYRALTQQTSSAGTGKDRP